jgi:hypothetical protein
MKLVATDNIIREPRRRITIITTYRRYSSFATATW